MRSAADFDAYSTELAARAAATPGVDGLVLLGSTSEVGRARRDEWSDHDFFAVLAPDAAADLRERLPFLPRRDRIVLIAREGPIGCNVLYDDGHVFEFGAGTLDEIGAVRIDRHEIVHDRGPMRRFAEEAVERGLRADDGTAADAAGRALVKLLIGFGRARRGEVLSGGAFVRAYAVQHLALAVRLRQDPTATAGEPDPLRRFERDHPSVAAAIADAVALPVEAAALQLLALTRETLEPGWADFPSAAADVVDAALRN